MRNCCRVVVVIRALVRGFSFSGLDLVLKTRYSLIMTTTTEITAALSDLINELDALYSTLGWSVESRNEALGSYRWLLVRALVEEEERNSED